MRSWLKALLVFVALAAGFPCAAWAHAGDEHGGSHAARHTVVPDSVTPGSGAGLFSVLDWTAVQGLKSILVSSFASRPVAHLQDTGQIQESRPGSRATPHHELSAALTKQSTPLLHQGSCCCGSVACHAGVDLPVVNLAEHCAFSDKIELPPGLALTGAVPGGIERPPRSAVSL
jgi:hypothetical protein